MTAPTDDLKNRLKKALNIRGMKPIELSEATKIPKSAISQYMSGYAKPKDDRIFLISKALNIQEAWLLGYDVPMDRPLTYNPNMPIAIKPTKNIPIVGTVACGNPIYAEENILEYIPVNETDNVDFALYAEGDSMNNCKIDDGDIIYIRAQSIVENGEIALVLVNNDTATVKRFYDYGDKIVLRPDSNNPANKEQIYEKGKDSIIIQGKVIFIKAYVK